MSVIFSAKGISKTFSNGNTALNNVSVAINEGDCVLLAGANGSGKTLLMKILTGLTEPSAGQVFYRDAPLFGPDAKQKTLRLLRREVGLVFQDADAQILGETALEDACFGLRARKVPRNEAENRARAALTALGLTAKADFAPRALSGGERRRLAVAGALAVGAETVLMDEPFANLDWPGVSQVCSCIQALKNNGKTLVILTHELEKALAFANRLVVLFRGEKAADGEPRAVLDSLRPEWGVRDPRVSYKTVEDCSWLPT
jgi:biotin transport system ATP-binding protein